MKKYPRILFEVSYEYNEMFAYFSGKPFADRYFKTLREIAQEAQELWDKYNDKVFQAIEEKTDIILKPRGIRCYFVWAECCFYPSFSNPLTVKVGSSRIVPFGTIIHELLHQIFTCEGSGERENLIKSLVICFPKENFSDLQHIFINALTFQVLKRVWGKEFADKVIKKHRKMSTGKRGWELVDQIGPSILERNIFAAIKEYCDKKDNRSG